MKVPEGIADPVLSIQNELTLKLAQHISARKDITVTKTVLNGVYCIRFAVGAERTQEKHIDAAFQLISGEARQVLADFYESSANRHYAKEPDGFTRNCLHVESIPA